MESETINNDTLDELMMWNDTAAPTTTTTTGGPSVAPLNEDITPSTPSRNALLGDDDDTTANILAIGWIFIFFYCCFCNRRRVPGPEHWRGAEMRRRYQEFLAAEQAKEARENQSPEYRQQLVQHNMRTKVRWMDVYVMNSVSNKDEMSWKLTYVFLLYVQRVISKDADGNWTLGSVTENIDLPPSPPTDIDEDEDDEDEHACVVCLEPFQVGDVVSWSRHQENCHHVFHTDCISHWLEGKRMEDCPSCRHRIILQEPPKEKDNSDIEMGSSSKVAGVVSRDPSGDTEDSFFRIVQGLITRAASKASYTLIGSKDIEDDSTEGQARLPPPSPFRRVFSHEPRPSPPHNMMIVGGMMSSLDDVAVSSSEASSFLSIHNFLPSSSNDPNAIPAAPAADDRTIQTIISNSSYDDDDVLLQDGSVRMERLQLHAARSSPLNLRRVKSDIGGIRRYPMMRARTKAPSSMMYSDHHQQQQHQHNSHSNNIPNGLILDDDDDFHDGMEESSPRSVDIFRLPTKSSTLKEGSCDEDSDNSDENMSDEEDDLQWITPSNAPESPNRRPSACTTINEDEHDETISIANQV